MYRVNCTKSAVSSAVSMFAWAAVRYFAAPPVTQNTTFSKTNCEFLAAAPEYHILKKNWDSPRAVPQNAVPSKKLFGCEVSTLNTLFCLICTINSKLKYFPISTNLGEPGSISAGFQRTGSIPAGFQKGIRADIVLRDLWKRCFWAQNPLGSRKTM